MASVELETRLGPMVEGPAEAEGRDLGRGQFPAQGRFRDLGGLLAFGPRVAPAGPRQGVAAVRAGGSTPFPRTVELSLLLPS